MRLFFILLQVFISGIALSQNANVSYVYFETNKYLIPSDQATHLDTVIAKQLQQTDTIVLNGHTDKVGNPEYNLELSKKRCAQVEKYLIEELEVTNPIKKRYYGEANLLKEGDTESSHLKNRRVEMYFKKKLNTVLFEVSDNDSGEKIDAKIIIKTKGKTYDNEGINQIKIVEDSKEKVVVTAVAEGYLPTTKLLNSVALLKGYDYKFTLKKMEFNSKFPIPNLFFYGDVARLKESSYSSLDNIQIFLEVNKKTCVELSGHINLPIGRDILRTDPKFNLSIARAQVVYNFLTEKGVDSTRFLVKGYGNHRMIFPNAKTAKQQSQNRRVEIEIVKCDSIQNIQNDLLSQVALDKEINLFSNRLFTKKTLKKDLLSYSDKERRDILEQVKFLESEGKNPAIYTYSEILQLYKLRTEKTK